VLQPELHPEYDVASTDIIVPLCPFSDARGSIILVGVLTTGEQFFLLVLGNIYVMVREAIIQSLALYFKQDQAVIGKRTRNTYSARLK
jgi:hypothetical protein